MTATLHAIWSFIGTAPGFTLTAIVCLGIGWALLAERCHCDSDFLAPWSDREPGDLGGDR